MSDPRRQAVAAEPVVRGVVAGIGWPGIPADPGAHLAALLFQLERSQWLAAERLRERQLDQLRHLLRHARATVSHYAGFLRDIDVDRLDWNAFEALPRLSRKALQDNFASLRSSAVPPGHGTIVEGQSSGSTGMPVRFLQTEASQLFWNVLTLREHLWQERDFSGKLAAIRIKVQEGRWPDWGLPAAALFRTGPGATLNVRTDVERQLDWLVREDPDYLITHASNLQALRPDLREVVRAAWGVGVADAYSCEEAGYIALQCPLHEHYHVQAENLIVEILDEAGRPCGPGETGRVVLTPLHNFAMPLIRYELGDYAEAGTPCECGRGLPVIVRIHGRQRNMLVLPDGRRHWPSFPGEMWREVAPVAQFRLVQRTVEEIEAQYVMARELAAEEKMRLEEALAQRFGHRFRIVWTRRNLIERGAGYKLEDFVSEL